VLFSGIVFQFTFLYSRASLNPQNISVLALGCTAKLCVGLWRCECFAH